MKLVCAPNGIIDPERPRQGIADIKNAGFENTILDFSEYLSGYEITRIGVPSQRQSTKKNQILENPANVTSVAEPFIKSSVANGLCLEIAYAPTTERDMKRTDLYDFLVRVIDQSIISANKAGCKYIVIRPYCIGLKYDELWEVNRKFYLHFSEQALKSNIQILLENQCKVVGGHYIRGACSDAREACAWIDELNAQCGKEIFGFCMNVAVSNLVGTNMYDFITKLGKRLKMVILSENDGSNEDYLLPFSSARKKGSQLDWLNLVRGLRAIGFEHNLVIRFDDTAASFSPILRPQVMKLAKATADYIKWQIEMEALLSKYSKIVLFGAGNMCRNYMKCYGKEHPPLFTCDNNKEIWESEFCGLRVKSPDSLKQLPEGCAIFICNIYYREIEQQLRNMGIKNPIEFFNDEYMPTYYFDRLESR